MNIKGLLKLEDILTKGSLAMPTVFACRIRELHEVIGLPPISWGFIVSLAPTMCACAGEVYRS